MYSTDGSALAPGKEVTIEVSLWAYSAGNRVDLYAAEDVTNPAWTLFKVLTPPGRGPSTLTATYTLPAHITGVPAIRAALRYTGASSSCDGGGYNDRDDLAFTVSAATACSAALAAEAPQCQPHAGLKCAKHASPGCCPRP